MVDKYEEIVERKKRRGILSQVNKGILLEEKEKIIREIIRDTNNTLYSNYLKLKKLIEINKTIYDKGDLEELETKLNYKAGYIRYLLRFDSLKDKSWLEKISGNLILLVLGFNDETRTKQDEYFNTILSKKFGINETRIFLIKKYVDVNYKEGNKYKSIIYKKLLSNINSIQGLLNLSKRAEFDDSEKENLKIILDNLLTKIREFSDSI